MRWSALCSPCVFKLARRMDRSIQHIKHLGKKAGVAICPATPVNVLEDVIEDLDLVLVMTINPGFGGQELIPYTLRKVRRVREMLDARNPSCDLEVDGGIELHTIRSAYEIRNVSGQDTRDLGHSPS
jgi:ribulose-phosphate 3-epimerase